MKMRNDLIFIAVVLVLAIGFTACHKDKDKPAPKPVSVNMTNVVANVDSTGNHFTFVSLENGKVVSVSDSNTTKWDIAFRSTTIIVNGGKSGPGNGGAFVQRGTTFDNYVTIPADSVFKVDGMNGVTHAITTGSNKGWYSYDMNKHIITPIAGNLLVVRTASGKYAKVEILNYYRNAPSTIENTDISGFYKFRYVFQADGSKTF